MIAEQNKFWSTVTYSHIVQYTWTKNVFNLKIIQNLFGISFKTNPRVKLSHLSCSKDYRTSLKSWKINNRGIMKQVQAKKHKEAESGLDWRQKCVRCPLNKPVFTIQADLYSDFSLTITHRMVNFFYTCRSS